MRISVFKKLLLAYHPRFIKDSLRELKKIGLYHRLIFVLLMVNASFAANGYITASVGISFGKELGTSLLAIIGIGYQVSKILVPMFRGMKLSKIIKLMLCIDITSIAVMVTSLALGNDGMLFLGYSLITMASISLVIAYQNALQMYMARDNLKPYITRYNYTFNTLDVLSKLIVGVTVGTLSLYLPIFGVILCVIMLVISLHYQLVFLEEVKKNDC